MRLSVGTLRRVVKRDLPIAFVPQVPARRSSQWSQRPYGQPLRSGSTSATAIPAAAKVWS